jgi:hypothetical protein
MYKNTYPLMYPLSDVNARQEGCKGLSIGGVVARWYATTTVKDMPKFKRPACRLTNGGRLLEVAPVLGYFTFELARLGTEVTALV